MFLDKKEVEFFTAVKNNKTSLVKEKLNDANNCVNRDAINSDGKTAFQIAAEKSNIPMIRVLLKDIEDTELYSVLSQCVISNNLDCMKKIITELPDKRAIEKNEIIKLINEASQLKHYEIVHFFIQNDLIKSNDECTYSICEKEANCKEVCVTDIHRSQVTINRFKVLTNPVFICLR